MCFNFCHPFTYSFSKLYWKAGMKWRLSCSFMFNSLQPQGLYSPSNSPGQITGVGSLSLLQEIFPTRDHTQVSHIAGGFFTSWATREAQNTGVGSLSLLRWIFLTQESNQGLLHCRRILYQLRHKESPVERLLCPNTMYSQIIWK